MLRAEMFKSIMFHGCMTFWKGNPPANNLGCFYGEHSFLISGFSHETSNKNSIETLNSLKYVKFLFDLTSEISEE